MKIKKKKCLKLNFFCNAACRPKILENMFDKFLEMFGEKMWEDLENLSVLVKDNQGCFLRDGSR